MLNFVFDQDFHVSVDFSSLEAQRSTEMPQQRISSISRTETRHSYASTDRATIKKQSDISPLDLPPAAPRTIDSLRNQVAEEIALKVLRKVEHVDGK